MKYIIRMKLMLMTRSRGTAFESATLFFASFIASLAAAHCSVLSGGRWAVSGMPQRACYCFFIVSALGVSMAHVHLVAPVHLAPSCSACTRPTASIEGDGS
jgi:hypothetical protein